MVTGFLPLCAATKTGQSARTNRLIAFRIRTIAVYETASPYTEHYMVFLLIIAAGFAAGVINSVAGGGSFLTFPSLVFAGLPAVAANASSTVALVPGSATAAFSYRQDMQRLEQSRIKSWFIVSLIGGALGAVLLLATSDKTFRQIAPWSTASSVDGHY